MRTRTIATLLLGLALLAGCDQANSSISDDPPTSVVSVTVGLSASEVGAATVTFWVNHPTALPQPITGNVAVADPVTTFTLTQIPVVPATDPPYTLFMTARKDDGSWVCEGTTTFVHDEAGVTTDVDLTLTCPTSDDLPNGEIGIDVTFDLNYCPVIDEISAAPQTTTISDPVMLQALGTDPDDTAPVTYLWEASNGLITDGTQPTTTYTCATIGDHTITLTISDSDVRCDQRRQLVVSCNPDALCGNGVREVTEFCDDSFNDGGDLECLNCTEFQICLDSIVAGTEAVSYTHLTLPTRSCQCRSRWSPCH